MYTENKTKKFISALIIILILVSAISFSLPKQVRAAIVPAAPVQDVGFLAWLRNIFLGTSAGSTAVNTGLHFADIAQEVLKEAARQAALRLLQKMTAGIVDWINTGFHGSPLFLTNPDSFFKDIAKSEIKNLIDITGYDPNRFPFGAQFALNSINSYKRQFADNAQYSLSRVINDPTLLNNYRTNFNYGGWNGFLLNTQYPQNNYLGYNMMAAQQLASKLQGTVQNAAQKVQTTLNQGMGFLSPQTCPTNPAYNTGPNEFQRPKWDAAAYEKTHPYDPPPAVYTGEQIDGVDILTPESEKAIAIYKLNYQDNKDLDRQQWDEKNTCPGGLVNTTPGSVAANRIMTALGADITKTGLQGAVGGSIAAILDNLLGHFINQGLTELGGLVNPAPPTDNWSFNGSTLGGTTAPTNAGALVIPQNVSVDAGTTTSTTISGGTPGYFIQTPPNAAIATADISGTTLTITGIAPGPTTVTVRDSSATPKPVTISITINKPGDLVAIPQKISADIDDTVTATISGGTPPYIMITSSNQAIAQSVFAGTTLVVTGIKPGNTAVVIQDSSPSAKTTTIPIKINGPTDLVIQNDVKLNLGDSTDITISGGTPPYTISNQGLDPTIATAVISASGSTITIKGIAAGSTGIIVQDSSVLEKFASVNITVTPPAGPTAAPLGDCIAIGTLTSGILSHNVTASTCTSFGGTFVANLPNINGIPLGSCEVPNGTVESNITANACGAVRGIWTPNQ